MFIFTTFENAINQIGLNLAEIKQAKLPETEMTHDDSERLGKALSKNHHLEHIVLSKNNIDDAKLEEILKSINPSLKEIDLSYNQISFVGAGLLAEKFFAKINLSHNEMTHDAIESFAESSSGESSSLHSLDFSYNQFCAVKEETLVDLVKNNTSLEELQLEGNGIRPAILGRIATMLQGRVSPSVAASALGENEAPSAAMALRENEASKLQAAALDGASLTT